MKKQRMINQFFDEKLIVLHGNLSRDNGKLSFHFQDLSNVWSRITLGVSFETSASSFRNNDIVTAVWKDNDYFELPLIWKCRGYDRTLAFKYSEGSAKDSGFRYDIFAKWENRNRNLTIPDHALATLARTQPILLQLADRVTMVAAKAMRHEDRHRQRRFLWTRNRC